MCDSWYFPRSVSQGFSGTQFPVSELLFAETIFHRDPSITHCISSALIRPQLYTVYKYTTVQVYRKQFDNGSIEGVSQELHGGRDRHRLAGAAGMGCIKRQISWRSMGFHRSVRPQELR